MLTFTVTIAEVPCQIICQDEQLFQFFKKIYQPFLATTTSVQFTFFFSRTQHKKGALLRSCSLSRFRAELAINNVHNEKHTFLFHYLFKVAFAQFYIAKQYGMLVHASSLMCHGKAIVLAGDKGTGKSTSMQFLCEQGCMGLSDDVAILQVTDEAVSVHTSPFQDRHVFSKKNISLLVSSVFFLHKTKTKDSLKELSMIQRANTLYYHSYSWGFGYEANKTTMRALRVLAYKAASSIRCFDVYLHTITPDTVKKYFM